ncbi:hypothetical protein GCM10020256_71900 [Streptomyces thermocoprophilus]
MLPGPVVPAAPAEPAVPAVSAPVGSAAPAVPEPAVADGGAAALGDADGSSVPQALSTAVARTQEASITADGRRFTDLPGRVSDGVTTAEIRERMRCLYACEAVRS